MTLYGIGPDYAGRVYGWTAEQEARDQEEAARLDLFDHEKRMRQTRGVYVCEARFDIAQNYEAWCRILDHKSKWLSAARDRDEVERLHGECYKATWNLDAIGYLLARHDMQCHTCWLSLSPEERGAIHDAIANGAAWWSLLRDEDAASIESADYYAWKRWSGK